MTQSSVSPVSVLHSSVSFSSVKSSLLGRTYWCCSVTTYTHPGRYTSLITTMTVIGKALAEVKY